MKINCKTKLENSEKWVSKNTLCNNNPQKPKLIPLFIEFWDTKVPLKAMKFVGKIALLSGRNTEKLIQSGKTFDT